MEAHPQDEFRSGLADQIITAVADILDEYERALRALDSPLLKDELSRTQCLAHARQILEKTAQEIRGEEPPLLPVGLAKDIGATRATAGIHPGESLRAANVLLSTAVHRIATRLSPVQPVDQVILISLTMHDVLTRVLRAAADSYAGVLLNRVHQAQVEERRRISRDLHDRIGNGISVAQRNLELYDIFRTTDPARADARVQTARAGLHETIDAVRQVISELRLVEPLESLEKALKLFLESAATSDMVSHVEVNGDETWAPTETIEEIFLIVREALRNTISHAGATRVLVRIDIAPNELRAAVHDNGRGFDPTVGRRGGTGLLSMRERAALLGGNLTLVSLPGQGTQIQLSVPLTGSGK